MMDIKPGNRRKPSHGSRTREQLLPSTILKAF
jgi:hypothetical protein